MMNLPDLYPLKFTTHLKRVIWGGKRIAAYKGIDTGDAHIGESWEISDLDGKKITVAGGTLSGKTLSELIELYGDRLVGPLSMRQYGNRFPLLFKFIDARHDLSIQVHPDQQKAQELRGENGKYEICYVIDAAPGARFLNGLNRPLTVVELEEALLKGNVTGFLNSYQSEEADFQYVPAGRIHAIGAGHLLAEIQQASDVTFRLHDYGRRDENGRERELHIAEAKEVIDTTPPEVARIDYDKDARRAEIAVCPWFVINRLVLKDGEKVLLPPHEGSFLVAMVIEGNFTLTCKGADATPLRRGETVFIPASLQETAVEGSGVILTTHLPNSNP